MKIEIDSLDKELLLRLKAIMALRVILLTGLLILIFPIHRQFDFSGSILPLGLVIGFAYFLSLCYALLLKVIPLTRSAQIQMTGDLWVVGGVLFTTGGIESPLSFLFVFVIVATGLVLSRSACYWVASGASVLYGLMVDLEYYGIIHPIYLFTEVRGAYEGAYGFYIICLNIISYYSVGYLSSLLADRLRVIKDELASTTSNLEDLQAFQKNVAQNMETGLVTVDLKGRITSSNRAIEKITGFSARDLQNRRADSIFPLPGLKTLLAAGSPTTLPLEFEGECRKRDGAPIWVRMKASHLGGEEEPSKGYILVFEDLTKIKEMQEKVFQAEQLAALGRLSAGLAHEIRNPLASLSGSIQVLNQNLHLEEKYRRLMEIVLKETDRLNSILSDFLWYSQPRKSGWTRINIHEVVQEVITLMKNSREYNPAIQIKFSGEVEQAFIEADEQQIKQVLWNLCINGLQAMNSSGILNISIERVPEYRNANFASEKKGILLTVEDQGVGIPASEIRNIFDPFYSLKQDGVGLGLATVYQIVLGSGGTIDVQSQFGQGARFSVYLPEGTPPPTKAPMRDVKKGKVTPEG